MEFLYMIYDIIYNLGNPEMSNYYFLYFARKRKNKMDNIFFLQKGNQKDVK